MWIIFIGINISMILIILKLSHEIRRDKILHTQKIKFAQKKIETIENKNIRLHEKIIISEQFNSFFAQNSPHLQNEIFMLQKKFIEVIYNQKNP